MKSFDLISKPEFLSVIVSIHHDELQIIDVPVTPPRLGISRCRTRNSCASNMLEGLFLDPWTLPRIDSGNRDLFSMGICVEEKHRILKLLQNINKTYSK